MKSDHGKHVTTEFAASVSLVSLTSRSRSYWEYGTPWSHRDSVSPQASGLAQYVLSKSEKSQLYISNAASKPGKGEYITPDAQVMWRDRRIWYCMWCSRGCGGICIPDSRTRAPGADYIWDKIWVCIAWFYLGVLFTYLFIYTTGMVMAWGNCTCIYCHVHCSRQVLAIFNPR